MRITYNVPVPSKKGRILNDESKAIEEFNAGRKATMCLEYDERDTAYHAYVNVYNRVSRKGYAIRVMLRGLCIYLEKLK